MLTKETVWFGFSFVTASPQTPKWPINSQIQSLINTTLINS